MLSKFIPRLQISSIYDIDLHAMREQGYKGIITDLDNTLAGAREPQATPELLEWLEQLKQFGFDVVIVSNNHRPRVEKFAEPLGIPYLYRAKKPINAPFRKALELLKLPANEVMMIGDQLLTDVFGGNRMGLYTILVNPISRQDEGLTTRCNRQMEKLVLAVTKKKVNKREADSKTNE